MVLIASDPLENAWFRETWIHDLYDQMEPSKQAQPQRRGSGVPSVPFSKVVVVVSKR